MSLEIAAKSYLVVAGPTGSGKSSLAMVLAKALGGEIVSCDSVQLYRGFDIGSAKPSPRELIAIRHHMVDVANWDEEYDAASYAVKAREALAKVHASGRLPIVVGGTGLYLRALFGAGFHEDLPKDEALRERLKVEDTAVLFERLKKLDPTRAGEIHPNDRFRVVRSLELVTLLGKPLKEAKPAAESTSAHEAYVVLLDPPRQNLHDNIRRRAEAMLAQGLLDEVRGLLASGVDPAAKPMQSIGYKQAVMHLGGDLLVEQLEDTIVFATRQYAKRQSTWFRKVEADERLATWETVELSERLRHVFFKS